MNTEEEQFIGAVRKHLGTRNSAFVEHRVTKELYSGEYYFQCRKKTRYIDQCISTTLQKEWAKDIDEVAKTVANKISRGIGEA